jgi:hypothetical protein
MRIQVLVVAAFMAVVGVAVGLLLGARPATAQETVAPITLAQQFANLQATETRVTVEFQIPLISGERTWTLPDESRGRAIDQIGVDFVCFRERWNDDTRLRCTPYSNIASLTFIAPTP